MDSLIQDCDLSNLSDESLEEMVQQLGNKFKNALDKNAPIKTKVTTVRKTVPWFNKNLRTIREQYGTRNGYGKSTKQRRHC